MTLWLTEKGLEGSMERLAELGFNGQFDSPEFGEHYRVGGAELYCDHKLWKGKTHEDWICCHWCGDKGVPDELPADRMSALNAKFAHLAATRIPVKPSNAQKPPEMASEDVSGETGDTTPAYSGGAPF